MSIWIQTQQELKGSILEVEKVYQETMQILERMKEHAEQIMEEEDTKGALRLSRAMERLSENIEELNAHWNLHNGN